MFWWIRPLCAANDSNNLESVISLCTRVLYGVSIICFCRSRTAKHVACWSMYLKLHTGTISERKQKTADHVARLLILEKDRVDAEALEKKIAADELARIV